MPPFTRRRFIVMAGMAFIAGLFSHCDRHMQLKTFARKIKGRLKKSRSFPPEAQRTVAVYPEGGELTSVERALNSRCSSDFDNDPTIHHWGMFDPGKKLSQEQIIEIIHISAIPRFSKYLCEIRNKSNTLIFVIDGKAEGFDREVLMIESGMQQQAVSLVCAALGVGSLIRNAGIDGTQLPDGKWCTAYMTINPMKQSYGGSYWSIQAPATENAWKQGNLPDPKRDGGMPLINALSGRLIPEKKVGVYEMAIDHLGQILWSAKGRTPHFYKSIPWGMTIPTWDGTQEITSIFVCNQHGLFKYQNWVKNHPTHSLSQISESNESLFKKMQSNFPEKRNFIYFVKNKPHMAALWECGYSLISALVQLKALNIHADIIFPKQEFGRLFAGHPINIPSVMITI